MPECTKHTISIRKPVSATRHPDTELRVARIIQDNRKLLFTDLFPSWDQTRVLSRIAKCRTEEMRSHIWRCTSCDYEEVRYNSCQNRNCPSCYTIPRSLRLTRIKDFMLRVPHSMVTFIPPAGFRLVARQSSREYFHLLFRSVADSLINWARQTHDVSIGITSTLHTWTRSLLYFPHLHTQVTAGGLNDGQDHWVPFEFSGQDIQELESDFRQRMTEGLWTLFDKDRFAFSNSSARLADRRHFQGLMDKVKDRDWKVHLSPQDGNVEAVLSKQIPYIHRPPITDSRLVSYSDGRVTFKTQGNCTVTITAADFLKRFISHILPLRFKSSRYYGLYSNQGKRKALLKAFALTHQIFSDSPVQDTSLWEAGSWQDVMKLSSGKDPNQCPRCGKLTMVSEEIPDVAAPVAQVQADQNKALRYGQLQLIKDSS